MYVGTTYLVETSLATLIISFFQSFGILDLIKYETIRWYENSSPFPLGNVFSFFLIVNIYFILMPRLVDFLYM